MEKINYSDIKFKKKYGQNFINDNNVFKSIVNLISENPRTLIIEIGPGAGVLTDLLCKKASHVIAFEVDETLSPTLDEVKNNNCNLEVIYTDFLKVNLADYISDKFDKIIVVGNLPYYITTPIIEKLTSYSQISQIILMVQKEVGQRICANSHSKEYGYFTLFLRFFYLSKIILNVPRTKFTPVPQVDSVVLELTAKRRNNVINPDKYFKLLRDAFTFKRKNLKNNLKEYDLELVLEVLSKYNLDLTSRAEEVDEDIFIELSNHIL